MVISSLTMYAVVLSCFTLLVGRAVATTVAPTPPEAATRPGDRRGSRPIKEAGGTKVKAEPSPRVLQGNYTAASDSARDLPREPHDPHAYFALFDPVHNLTRRFQVQEASQPLPARLVFSQDDSEFFGLNDVVERKAKKSKTSHPWHEPKSGFSIRNFLSRDTLTDSEMETRVHVNGVTAKETMVNTGTDQETGQRQGLKLRQLTDGSNFIQLIYTMDDRIQDCEFIRQKKIIHRFLDTFRRDVERAKVVAEGGEEKEVVAEEEGEAPEADDEFLDDEGGIESFPADDLTEGLDDEYEELKNVTFEILADEKELPADLAEWMNIPKLKDECKRTHRALKKLIHDKEHGDEHAKLLATEHFERAKRGVGFKMIAPGTKWCGGSHTAERYTDLGGFTRTDRCCRAHDHCHTLIPPFDSRYNYFNFRPFTLSHCSCDARRKRDLMDVFRVPGTKWCGKGKRAAKYTSLGGFSRADKCCRLHDTTCPFWIGGFEEKYGLFNWRINTIMHCRCDKRFRACLKMAKTGAANLVGKLFFNVVQTKCFVLKPQEVCLKTSWWGKCEKKKYQKKAYLKDNIPY